MWLPIEIKEEAVLLRKKGYSIKEIAQKLNIAQSTASLWLREIILSKKAQERLAKRQILKQYKASLSWQRKRELKENQRLKLAESLLKRTSLTKEYLKLLCALVYWCEGNKTQNSGVRFTNSDPTLIRVFLYLLRQSFELNESKFRVLMHLHKYHNEEKQKDFWGLVTGIPKTQFNKSYLKPNTGKRIHENYPGCIAIYYYNAEVARELHAIYNTFASLRA